MLAWDVAGRESTLRRGGVLWGATFAFVPCPVVRVVLRDLAAPCAPVCGGSAGPLALAREHLSTADHFFVFNR